MGEEHAGHENCVRVAPCLSRFAMDWIGSVSLGNFTFHPSRVDKCLFAANLYLPFSSLKAGLICNKYSVFIKSICVARKLIDE